MIKLKTEKEIEKLRKSAKLSAELRKVICSEAKVGITTDYLDSIAYEWIKNHDSKPAFLNYRGFPKTICISVNEEVLHGIPDKRILKSGDIVKIDVGLIHDGWYGDTATTIIIDSTTEEIIKFLKTSEEALNKTIEETKIGKPLGTICNIMKSTMTNAGYDVVREYGGHGIGQILHEEPLIPCHGLIGTGLKIQSGMVLAFEIMTTMGKPELQHKDGKWAAFTKDGSIGAHYEHMVAITNEKTEILTI